MTTPDFSLPMEPKKFRVDPDVFEAPPLIGAGTLRRIVEVYQSIGAGDETGKIGETLDKISEAFRLLLPGPHGERFVARLTSEGGPDDPPPLDLQRQVLPIMNWLLEQYGMRPTQPSSASTDGSTDGTATTPSDGTDSTDGASPTASETT